MQFTVKHNKMKKLILILSILILTISCSKDDDNSTDRSITVTDLGFELNTSYKVQQLQQVNSTTWDYVDFSPNVYVVLLNNSDIKETNQYGVITNKYSLSNTLLSTYPTPQTYISCNVDFTEPTPSTTTSFIVSPKSGCRFYRENNTIFLNKPVGSSNYEGFKFIKQ